MAPLVARHLPRLCRGLRPLSTSPAAAAAVSVTTDAEGVAVLSMNKAPVNSLNTEFIQELTQAVVDTEKAAKVREGVWVLIPRQTNLLSSPLHPGHSADLG